MNQRSGGSVETELPVVRAQFSPTDECFVEVDGTRGPRLTVVVLPALPNHKSQFRVGRFGERCEVARRSDRRKAE